jgi:hypothetical protein
MVMASVSTFKDHNATQLRRVAARRCFSCQTGMDISLDDIALYLIYLRPSASSSALAQVDSFEIEGPVDAAKLFRWLAFCAASGAGNEVPDAFLNPRIVEWIVQVLWSVSRGVVEEHAPNAGGALENRANKSSPHPQSPVERWPDRLSHPERLSHCSRTVERVRVAETNRRHVHGFGRGVSWAGSSEADLPHCVSAPNRDP